jgi:desulfoferrodoxin-like iron-binding protein
MHRMFSVIGSMQASLDDTWRRSGMNLSEIDTKTLRKEWFTMQKGQVYVCAMCGNTIEIVNVGGGTLVCCGVPMEKRAEGSASAGKADQHVIIGIHITDRVKHASVVQSVLTDFGCSIKTRLGLHEASAAVCSPNGLMLIEFVGTESQCADMVGKLSAVEGVEVQRMVFDHP